MNTVRREFNDSPELFQPALLAGYRNLSHARRRCSSDVSDPLPQCEFFMLERPNTAEGRVSCNSRI